jgi:translocator protein
MRPEATAPSTVYSGSSAQSSAWMLALSLFLVFLAGGVGSLTAPDAWYSALEKPPLNPPGWVFGPVWTTLYILMAVAAWLVWRERWQSSVRLALTFYGGQLFLNAIWSPLFFGMHRPDLALIDLIALWGVLGATILRFWRIRPLAGALLLPYLAWVTFAGYLNAAIWWLNLA